MKKIICLSLLLVLAFTFVEAQNQGRPSFPVGFDKIRTEKISFFTEKLSLTPAEAQVFWPVYNEFERKRFEIQGQKHYFESLPVEKYRMLSDTEIEKLTANYIESFEKEATLLKEYNKQFLKILPKKKVLMLYRTENDFRGYLIREFRGGRNRD
jgi:hypothetical protein